MTTDPTGFYEKRHPAEYRKFQADTAQHRMAPLHDDGLYRHLYFRKPDDPFYWFEIITWPGSLVIRGDMGDYLFTRMPDMFEFFGTGDINPGYWAEKTPGYGTGYRIKTYNPDLFENTVRSLALDFIRDHTVIDVGAFHAWINGQVLEHKDDHHGAVRAAHECTWNGHDVFPEIHAHDFTDYTPQFLWSCFAIPFAIRRYRGITTAPDTPPVEEQ